MYKKHPRLSIDYFITIESSLGLPHVVHKMHRRIDFNKNSKYKKWSNFSDRREFVAFDEGLKNDYDKNYLGIKVFDDLVYNNFEDISHIVFAYLRTPELSEKVEKFIKK